MNTSESLRDPECPWSGGNRLVTLMDMQLHRVGQFIDTLATITAFIHLETPYSADESQMRLMRCGFQRLQGRGEA